MKEKEISITKIEGENTPYIPEGISEDVLTEEEKTELLQTSD